MAENMNKHVERWDKGIKSGYKAADAEVNSPYSWYGRKKDGTIVLGIEVDHIDVERNEYDESSGKGYKKFMPEEYVLKTYGSSSLGNYRKVKTELSSTFHMKKPFQILKIRGSRNSGDMEAKRKGTMSMYIPDDYYMITRYEHKDNGELWVFFEKID